MYEDYDYYEEFESEFDGAYAHYIEEYSDDDIYDVFDGNPDAYWNID